MTGVGWRPVTRRRFERDFEQNPALAGEAAPVSRGFVLEDGARVVGFVGNLIQRFDWRGRSLRAASPWGFVVAPEARGNSMRLLVAFARQPGMDLLLAATATGYVPEILGLLKFERLPVADYDVGLYWVTGARGLAGSSLRRLGVPGPWAAVGGALAAPVVWAETWLAGRRPPTGAAPDVEIERLDPRQVGPEFDALWQRKRAESQPLAVVRSAAVLRWHFAPDGWDVAPVLLAARRAGELIGYAVLVRSDKPDNGLTRWQIADLLVLNDEPEPLRALLRASWEHARSDGVAMLELFGCPQQIRAVVAESRPRPWKKACWPYLYRAADPQMRAALRSPDAWYPTLIDGDGCLPHL